MNSTYAFWALAAVFVAVALAFLLPPLLRKRPGAAHAGRSSINIAVYRDQLKEMEADHRNGLLSDDQFAAAKIELEARLAQDALVVEDPVAPARRGGRVLGGVLAVLVPVLAVALYLQVGTPDALLPAAVRGEHDIQAMIDQVEAKTRSEPGNVDAWAMLARTYAAVGRWQDALAAYDKANTLKPNVPAVMTGYAEALAVNNDRVLQGKPMELILKALEIDPEDIKGLELAGIASFQTKNYAKAADYFGRLLKLVPPESPYAQDIAQAAQEARRLAQGGPAHLDNLSEPSGAKAAPTAQVAGRLELAPALKGQVAPTDTVFLFARGAGGGAPAAALRASVGDLPLDFALTDAMAMSADNRLSNLKEVDLVARIAKSGDIKGAAGDLEGHLAKVKVGAKGVKLVIDTVRK
ncbi:c-type cytochrome biogenesis protein CcmI [Parasulfuritortus cantonensis]|uniref:C-type cytochrome biogenesis protein CcmI n=1 Tax=Parasulfuritortus cantonensis TaxID=2528202 RepID=A0A4R1BIX2_9PROT|nr:c-type cytochrome biogenesis protein CcmI [Parasulfuritortus cantonensis]TCJ17118.1 c-type cytochrome biogenesis protein CcmI [Parasulfuritortus cantonensis]